MGLLFHDLEVLDLLNGKWAYFSHDVDILDLLSPVELADLMALI